MSSWNLAWNIILVRLSWAVLQPVYSREAESCAECGQEQLNCNKPSHNIPILGSFAIGDFLGIFCSWKYFSKYIFKVLGGCKKSILWCLPDTEQAPSSTALSQKKKESTQINVPEKGASNSRSFAVSGRTLHRASIVLCLSAFANITRSQAQPYHHVSMCWWWSISLLPPLVISGFLSWKLIFLTFIPVKPFLNVKTLQSPWEAHRQRQYEHLLLILWQARIHPQKPRRDLEITVWGTEDTTRQTGMFSYTWHVAIGA